MPLIATSENTFVARVATVRFERDDQGVVNRLLWLRPVMGDVVAARVALMISAAIGASVSASGRTAPSELARFFGWSKTSPISATTTHTHT